MAKTYKVQLGDFIDDYLEAYSLIDNSYIGNEKDAQELENMGIAPQAIEGNTVASIGFCEAESKWYGWSHRAIFGFVVGSIVQKGDCGYVAGNWDDFVERSLQFWDDPAHVSTTAVRGVDPEGDECVIVSWVYRSDAKLIPNISLHGTSGVVFIYPPKTWGKGEWVAKTIDDAKQMAMDFAEGVA